MRPERGGKKKKLIKQVCYSQNAEIQTQQVGSEDVFVLLHQNRLCVRPLTEILFLKVHQLKI